MSIPGLREFFPFTREPTRTPMISSANTGTFRARPVIQLDPREEPFLTISQRANSVLQQGGFSEHSLLQHVDSELGASSPPYFESLRTLNAPPPGDLLFDPSVDYQQIGSPPKNSNIEYVGPSTGPLNDTFSSPFEPFINFDENNWQIEAAPQRAQPELFRPCTPMNEPWAWDAETAQGEVAREKRPPPGDLFFDPPVDYPQMRRPADGELNALLAPFTTQGTVPQYAQPAPIHPTIQKNERLVPNDEMLQEVDVVEEDAASPAVSSEQESSAEDDQALKKAKRGEKKAQTRKLTREKLRKGRDLLQEQKSGKMLAPDEQELVEHCLQNRASETTRKAKLRASLKAKDSQEGKIASNQSRNGKVLLQEKESGKILNSDDQKRLHRYLRTRDSNNERKAKSRAKRKAETAQEGEDARKKKQLPPQELVAAYGQNAPTSKTHKQPKTPRRKLTAQERN